MAKSRSEIRRLEAMQNKDTKERCKDCKFLASFKKYNDDGKLVRTYCCEVFKDKHDYQEVIPESSRCELFTEGENGYKGSDNSDNTYGGCLVERLIRRTENNA